MKIRLANVVICLGLACSQTSALADQVVSANVQFFQTYTQTADNTLGPLSSQSTQFILTTTSGGDLSAVSVTTPSSDTVNLIQGNGAPPNSWSLTTTLAPANGTYAFNTTGATISSQTIDNSPSGSFPTQLTLAGSSIENLAAANGTAPVNLTLTYYSASDNPDWNLFDTTTQMQVGAGGITSTSFQIPAADITTGQGYVLELVTSGGSNSVVNSINIGVGYNANTQITFGATATPEPSTMVILLFAGGLFIPVLRKARARAVQVA